MLASSPGPLVAATVGPGQSPLGAGPVWTVPGANMAATIGKRTSCGKVGLLMAVTKGPSKLVPEHVWLP